MNVNEYFENLVLVFREAKRVLCVMMEPFPAPERFGSVRIPATLQRWHLVNSLKIIDAKVANLR